MIAFGGAAGLHAIAVADEIGIRRVVFPESASTLSAYGILHSNLAHDLVRSKVLAATGGQSCARWRPMAESLVAEATARLAADAVPAGDRQHRARRRHALQGPGLRADDPGVAASHVRRGHARRSRREVSRHAPPALLLCQSRRRRWSSCRCASRPSVGCRRSAARSPRPRRSASRRASARYGWAGGWREVAAWSRGQIAPDVELKGPAVIEEAYTTVLIADGWSCWRDKSGHLIAERAQS